MTVRAKFVCASKTSTLSQGGYDEKGKYDPSKRVVQESFKFYAVGGGSEENQKFFASTPSGTVEINIVNPEAAAAFQLNREYYLDFTLAE